MFKRLGKRGQTTAEYAILIALVVAAAMAMQIYVKRGLQGRVKDVVDHTGTGGEVGTAGDVLQFSGAQYEPYYTSSAGQSSNVAADRVNVAEGGVITRNIEDENVSRGARRTVTGWEGEEVAAPALDAD
ncbi:MAG: class III signal peptide-containing protein [Candidatus Omnitrophica bacterium]|nr:class III signal peptide-containing protein [Candidatus Omnitrophota bacterium]